MFTRCVIAVSKSQEFLLKVRRPSLFFFDDVGHYGAGVCVCVCCMLYGCESWVLYQHLVRKLDEFHMRCLRRIAGIKWQDRVPNTEVLHLCGITGIEAFLLQAQYRWVGHVVRMQHDRIPKQILYGQLLSGKCPQCGPVRRYKDTVRDNLKRCGIHPQSLVSAPLDRGQWRSTCRTAIAAFEEARVASLQRKRAARKHQVVSSTTIIIIIFYLRHGRVIGATKSAHPELGSLPVVVPIDEAVRRTRRCSPCVNQNFT